AIFDVNWMEGMSFGLFPLEIASAAELATELDQIFGDTAEGPLAGVVRVVPIERLNAVLVVSAQPSYLDQAEIWVRRLDREGEGEEPQIYVYPVQNARATNLAEVLGEIFGARATTVGEPSLLAPGLEPTELRSTRGFELGTEQTRDEGLEEAEEEAEPQRRSRRERALAGQRGLAPRGPARRSTALSPLGAPTETPETDIRIIADDTTNSLVIQARPREYRRIQQALERLDVLPLQVLIEATIAEVTLSDELRYGVEWFFRSGDFELNLSSARRPMPQAGVFSALFSSDDLQIVLNALEEVTDVDVISSPQLLVLDNQTARLQVGDQVPITVQQATPITGDLDSIVSSVELRDTGVILTVTPRVNANGLVILEIQQEVSNVVRSETRTTIEQTTPTINQRQISSTVAVQSGETVALGGLITDNRERGRSGVPILSRIPILGALFSTRSNINNRTELLVMLTPSVISNQAEARAATEELRRRMSGAAPLRTQRDRVP
ncbi:MAG TPA: secretin N-terminal domain-containing protein, partial [Geminicoccaceae bacterium]|nr:secretin N-terminal domain-containing protein [Geminicoccaceae bacterium]